MEGKNQETSIFEDGRKHRLQVVYTRKMERRRIFMDELKDNRKENDKQVLKKIKESIGPIWYQVLTVPQRNALDALEFGIYQDLIEGRSRRTAKVMRALGIYPQPDKIDLNKCVYAGRNDPKEMLACLFLVHYGHYIHGKRSSYDLNARLMLSAILYLGMDDLIARLEERFRPETEETRETPKLKAKREPPPESPYLQKLIVRSYAPCKQKRQLPLPLPNLDEIDEPFEEEPMIPKSPPPPPPPPPPKNRLPRSYCDKINDMPRFPPNDLGLPPVVPVHTKTRKTRAAKSISPVEKKVYGIDTGLRKKSMRRRRPPNLTTGLWNAQYMIQGVYNVNDRLVYIICNVAILPPLGELIHGGFALVNGTYINIHCGFAARPEPNKLPPCECLKKYQETVFNYVIETKKCTCGHNYDYGNEGNFTSEEVPFFEKPTGTSPFYFNYNTIYELDARIIHVEKEFKKIWEIDSNLNIDAAALAEKKEKEKKRKRKKASNTCLGISPTPEDYLKCALRKMRPDNIAAKLPDIHLVPELKEWMRRRLFGPFSAEQKKKLLTKSVNNWNFLKFVKGMGHVEPPQEPAYLGFTTWAYKFGLSKKFQKYTHDYKLAMLKLHAKLNNILWATMCQAEFPDKNFREIFSSYVVAHMNDLHIKKPYSVREAADRKNVMQLKRYCCPPDSNIDDYD